MEGSSDVSVTRNCDLLERQLHHLSRCIVGDSHFERQDTTGLSNRLIQNFWRFKTNSVDCHDHVSGNQSDLFCGRPRLNTFDTDTPARQKHSRHPEIPPNILQQRSIDIARNVDDLDLSTFGAAVLNLRTVVVPPVTFLWSCVAPELFRAVAAELLENLVMLQMAAMVVVMSAVVVMLSVVVVLSIFSEDIVVDDDLVVLMRHLKLWLMSFQRLTKVSVLSLAVSRLNLLFELAPVLEMVSEVLTVPVVSTGVLRKLGSMIPGAAMISSLDISRDHRRNSHTQGENDGMRWQ